MPWWVNGIIFLGIALYFAYRLSEIEERLQLLDHSKLVEKLSDGRRRTPSHQRPESLRSGGAPNFSISPVDESVFADFNWFGAALNRHFENLSVEELNDTAVRNYDSPGAGRRYAVFYKENKIGEMQVQATPTLSSEAKDGSIYADVDLDLHSLQFLPYADAFTLIFNILRYIEPWAPGEGWEGALRIKAAAVLVEPLWEGARLGVNARFNYRVSGPYDLLRMTTEHWKANGINPFEQWDDV